jgi:Family of unknown function (DUF6632)
MDASTRLRFLRIALIVVGLIFLVGVYPLTMIWPAGWSWHPAQSEYLQMILVVYATLGIFLILAARDPLRNLSLIWFTVWSSLAHGGIMALQAMGDPEDQGHLLGDVPALLIVAIVLGMLTPRGEAARALRPATS